MFISKKSIPSYVLRDMKAKGGYRENALMQKCDFITRRVQKRRNGGVYTLITFYKNIETIYKGRVYEERKFATYCVERKAWVN